MFSPFSLTPSLARLPLHPFTLIHRKLNRSLVLATFLCGQKTCTGELQQNKDTTLLLGLSAQKHQIAPEKKVQY
jgi:hypothetical protein